MNKNGTIGSKRCKFSRNCHFQGVAMFFPEYCPNQIMLSGGRVCYMGIIKEGGDLSAKEKTSG